MKNIIVLFLLTTSIFAQDENLAIKIENIVTNNTNPKEQHFTINYSIENLTNKEVSFYLQSDKIIPNSIASNSLKTVYKIYENDVFIDTDGVFEKYWDAAAEQNKALTDPEYYIKLAKKYELFRKKDSIATIDHKNKDTIDDELDYFSNPKIKNLKVVLKPKEIKKYAVKCSWNKKRYSTNGDNEYYLNEKLDYSIAFMLVLSIEKLKNQVTEKEFQALKNDKTIVNGVFISNKVKIIFED